MFEQQKINNGSLDKDSCEIITHNNQKPKYEASGVQSLQTISGFITKEGDALRGNSWKRQTRVLPISGINAATDRPNEKQGNKREWAEFAGLDYMEVDCETPLKNGRGINEMERAAG
ncbi:hypothetical protein Tco_1469241 [Tanacetum coccineum]